MGASMGGGGSSSNNRRHRNNRFTEINVTPFVDVMLVLLVIFMVTAPMLSTGVTVDLPDADASTLPGQDEPLVLSISKDGTLHLQDSKVTEKELVAKLDAITSEKRDTRVFVQADRRLGYGEVMRIVGNLGGAGFTKVALLTDNKK
ncbi:MAG: protein TolR [Rickettsiales bacterium]|nr:protein TolR [Rickettsiales bacterium]